MTFDKLFKKNKFRISKFMGIKVRMQGQHEILPLTALDF